MNKEVSDALYMLLHCALKDKEFETQKEQFDVVYRYIEELNNKIDKLTNNLENSINSINAKLGDKEIRVENGKIVNPINDYRTVRLKAIRMKCKELQEILKDSVENEYEKI